MSYGFIFTDFSMPIMNGIDATKNIRDYLLKDKKIPRQYQPIIVGITGHVQEEYQQQGLDAGMDLVKSKPYSINTLREAMT